MTMKGMWAIAAVLSVALGIAAAPASASPVIGAGAGGLKAAAEEASPVDKARWVRRCWRDRWGRHCRRVWVSDFYGPGFGLYFGGPRRHHFRGYRSYRAPRFRGPGPGAFRFRGGPGPRDFGGGPGPRGMGRGR
jgi:hypothetical protein